jgi:hypothetical protein
VRYLGGTAEAGKYDLLGAIHTLAERGGPGPVRQLLHLLGHRLSGRGVRDEEYYTYALWRQDRGRAFLKDFLPIRRLDRFNASLRMPARGPADAALDDKLATEAILLARGLPVTRTRAAYIPGGLDESAQLPGLLQLRDAAQIAAYLGDAANLPAFGKPRTSSLAHGAATLEAHDGPDAVRFLGGTRVPIHALAAEIVQDWGQGYLFQPFYRAAPALQRHTGAAMASLRIVTLLTDRGVEPWYAVIRLPAAQAMHDGDADGQRIWGLVDLDSGEILRLRDLRDPMAPGMVHGHDPATPFLGQRLPDWTRAVEICRHAHESFPGNGIIGWDVFLTGGGPLLNEANANPGHVY